MNFWNHVDELRGVLLRSLIAVTVCAVAAFFMKDLLFTVVLAPSRSDFLTYRLLGLSPYLLQLINTGLTEQFMAHVRVALYTGLLCAIPYMLYALLHFISPGLYKHERSFGKRIIISAYAMFLLGVLVNYFLLFPLTLRFLATYQVTTDIVTLLTLQSYLDTFLGMSLALGIFFEMPIVCRLLAYFGILTASRMRSVRRHAMIGILATAAIITPTADAFTMLVAAFPLWLLYEGSILLISRTFRKNLPD